MTGGWGSLDSFRIQASHHKEGLITELKLSAASPSQGRGEGLETELIINGE